MSIAGLLVTLEYIWYNSSWYSNSEGLVLFYSFIYFSSVVVQFAKKWVDLLNSCTQTFFKAVHTMGILYWYSVLYWLCGGADCLSVLTDPHFTNIPLKHTRVLRWCLRISHIKIGGSGNIGKGTHKKFTPTPPPRKRQAGRQAGTRGD